MRNKAKEAGLRIDRELLESIDPNEAASFEQVYKHRQVRDFICALADSLADEGKKYD